MKIIIEQADLNEGNFDEELLEDVARMLYPLKVEIVFTDGKTKVINNY